MGLRGMLHLNESEKSKKQTIGYSVNLWAWIQEGELEIQIIGRW